MVCEWNDEMSHDLLVERSQECIRMADLGYVIGRAWRVHSQLERRSTLAI
jgi:hypothetical protein